MLGEPQYKRYFSECQTSLFNIYTYMISVFSATNRPGSNTLKVAQAVLASIEKQGEQAQLLSFEDLPNEMLHTGMYNGADALPSALAAIQDKYLVNSDKWCFVMPEYNGSYPGVLKLFIDACSVRRYKDVFRIGKKAALIGVADGRAGNLRGLEHFTGVLQYLRVNVMPNRLPISSISGLLSDNALSDAATLKAIDAQVAEFLNF